MEALTATQHVTTDPPGFVWDASVRVAPLLPTRVVDSYVAGDMSLAANGRSAIPVASATPDRRLNRAMLQRYLAEAVWYPTGLLPVNGVA